MLPGDRVTGGSAYHFKPHVPTQSPTTAPQPDTHPVGRGACALRGREWLVAE